METEKNLILEFATTDGRKENVTFTSVIDGITGQEIVDGARDLIASKTIGEGQGVIEVLQRAYYAVLTKAEIA